MPPLPSLPMDNPGLDSQDLPPLLPLNLNDPLPPLPMLDGPGAGILEGGGPMDSEYQDGGKNRSGLDHVNSSRSSTNKKPKPLDRQESSSSLAEGDISIKKMEDIEGEYGKMKLALLSDIEDDPEEEEMDNHKDLSPCGPEIKPVEDLIRRSSLKGTTLPVALSADSRQRSKDNLSSIFGGLGGEDVDPDVMPEDLHLKQKQRESRRSHDVFDVHNNNMKKSVDTKMHAKSGGGGGGMRSHETDTSSHVDLFESKKYSRKSPTAPGNGHHKSFLEDEPFPLSPEMEMMSLASSLGLGGVSSVHHHHERSGSAAGEVYTIRELPEEEIGSPTAIDGVSRPRSRDRGVDEEGKETHERRWEIFFFKSVFFANLRDFGEQNWPDFFFI